MIKIFEIATRSFPGFIAVIVILYMLLYFPTNLILEIVHKLIRAKTIAKHGYPPDWCDGDGDAYKKGEE